MSIRLVFGDFELDEARYELRKRGVPVAMQPKVLDFILLLARHRDRVVTKEEVLEHVWKGVVVTEASLSQAVSSARRVLDDTPEAQHTIRTVRSKGMQFVADARVATPTGMTVVKNGTPVRASGVMNARLGSTGLETMEDADASIPSREVPFLFAALCCESLADGGAGWSLADVDEVHVVRGSERRSEREVGPVSRVLTIVLPGRLMSRRHARIVRMRNEWLVVDEGSKNGTFVNGERADKRSLTSGDVVECGRTLLLFTTEPERAGCSVDADSRTLGDSILPTVIPRVAAIARDLERIATSDLPILLLGESGVGKTRVAQDVHRLSGRRGSLVTLDGATQPAQSAPSPEALLERAARGTLLVENLERVPAATLASLAGALEGKNDVRVVCTSTTEPSELERRLSRDLLTRLSGFCCELPPLRARAGDLGVLVGRILERAGRPAGVIEVDVSAGRALVGHGWPGNLRELARSLEVASTLAAGESIRLEHLRLGLPARASG